MKKLVTGLLAAFLLTAGLVSFAGTSQAAPAAKCPYTGCLKTSTFLSHLMPIKKPGPVRLTVKARSGNAAPKGQLHISVSGPHGFHASRSKKVANDLYTFVIKLPRSGSYTVTGSFTPAKGTSYKGSSRTKSYTVH